MKGSASASIGEIPQFDWLMPLAPWEDPGVLVETLRSLADQTWQARALVVSVDGRIGVELEKVLMESGLVVELHEASEWQGTGIVLARGLVACKSDIVLRVDADDHSLPQRSELQVREMYSCPQLAAFGGQLKEIAPENKNPHDSRIRSVPLSLRSIKARSYWRNPMNHPTVALRRSLVLSAGNYRPALYFEDWDLWLRMLKQDLELRNDPRVFVEARVGLDHLSRRHGFRYLKAELSFLFRSACERLIPFPYVLIQCCMRLPLRVAPKLTLSIIMKIVTRANV
jgi:glycosyltransferase involved in cell wall biosynthesis